MSIAYIGNILYDEKLFKDESKIVIFDTGVCGKKVAEYLIKNCMKDNIICFCDSNGKLINNNIMGIKVWNPVEVCKKLSSAEYLISGKYSHEMYAFLKEKQIEKIHILVF